MKTLPPLPEPNSSCSSGAVGTATEVDTGGRTALLAPGSSTWVSYFPELSARVGPQHCGKERPEVDCASTYSFGLWRHPTQRIPTPINRSFRGLL